MKKKGLKIRNKQEDLTVDNTEIQRIIRSTMKS